MFKISDLYLILRILSDFVGLERRLSCFSVFQLDFQFPGQKLKKACVQREEKASVLLDSVLKFC